MTKSATEDTEDFMILMATKGDLLAPDSEVGDNKVLWKSSFFVFKRCLGLFDFAFKT